MSDLNSRARALVDSIRYAEDPSEEEIEHVHYKVLGRVAVGAAAGAAVTAAAKTAMAASAKAAASAGTAASAAQTGVAAGAGAVAATSSAVAVIKVGAFGALVGALTLGTTTIVSHHQESVSASAPTATGVAAHVAHGATKLVASPLISSEPLSPVEVVPAPEPQPTPVHTESVPSVASREGQAHQPTPSVAEPVATTLEAELSLMRQARAALNQGQTGLAVSLLDEHSKRFPAGVLAEDRMAIRIVALCSAGRGAQMKGEAEQFLASHPRSSHAASVRSACGVGSPSAAQPRNPL